MDSQAVTDGFELRRASIDSGTGLIVDLKTADFFVAALHRKWSRENAGRVFWGIRSWQEYLELEVR